MKKILLSLAAGATALVGTTISAEAGGHGYGHGYGYSTGNYRGVATSNQFSRNHSYSGHRHQCTPYLVSTCEVNRQTYCRPVYDSCGRMRQVHITVVTYKAHYSDGSCRTYTRSFYS